MLSTDETELRGFCARLLGWSDGQTEAVENAFRSIHFSITHRAPLVLLGDGGDLVSIAQALHRRTVGAEHPFVVCERRRSDTRPPARPRTSCESGVAAVEAARGGSLCVRLARLPQDFSSMVALMRAPAASVQLIVCGRARRAVEPILALGGLIQVPSLRTRERELPRIVDEYALDAISTLDALIAGLSAVDRAWVLGHAARTHSEIEEVTLRLVALRASDTITEAAAKLGMPAVRLRGWIRCRRLNRRGGVPS